MSSGRADPAPRGPYPLFVPPSLGPELCRLLEPGFILGRLREAVDPSVEIVECHLRHLRAHPGKDAVISVEVQYRCERTNSSGTTTLFARCESPATFERELRRSKLAAVAPGRLIEEVLVFPDLRAIWLEFPNDSRLPHLPLLLSPSALARVLAPQLESIVPEGWCFDAERFDFRILRYKPERRLVCSCDTSWTVPNSSESEALSLIIRFERVNLALTVESISTRLHRSLESVDGLQTPRILFAIPEFELVGMERISGNTLSSILEGDEGEHAASRAGRRLAQLHACGAFSLEKGDTPHRRRDLVETARLLDLACRGQVIDPAPVFERFAALEAASLPGPDGTVHGDFHPEQIVVGPEMDWLLDVEWAGLGETTTDIGSFCAQLWMLHQRGLIPDFDGYRTAFLSSYEAESGVTVDRQRLATKTIESLLELAAKQFRRLKKSWPKRVVRIVSECNRVLDESE